MHIVLVIFTSTIRNGPKVEPHTIVESCLHVKRFPTLERDVQGKIIRAWRRIPFPIDRLYSSVDFYKQVPGPV
jgi:hypothetical protein